MHYACRCCDECHSAVLILLPPPEFIEHGKESKWNMNFPPPLHTPNKRAKIKQHLVEQILLTVYSEPTVSPKSFCLYLGFSWGLLAVHMTYLWSWHTGVTYIFHDCWFWRITLVTSIDFWARNVRLNPALLYCLTMIVKYFHWNRDIMQFPEDDIYFWLVLSKTDEVMPVSAIDDLDSNIYIYIFFFNINCSQHFLVLASSVSHDESHRSCIDFEAAFHLFYAHYFVCLLFSATCLHLTRPLHAFFYFDSRHPFRPPTWLPPPPTVPPCPLQVPMSPY